MAQHVPAFSGGPPSPVNVGDIVDKYRVERVLGVGAMGVVVAARHTTLDQVVAIKFLLEHRFGSREESIARFLAEARAAARIDSDHVCRVSDVDMLPSGVPYMIMEYLEGNDLEDEIVARGQLEIGEAVDYVLQALDAMAAAHQLGIVHRDLKPANLFLARRPDGSRRVKVLDFGISKAETVGKERFTRETRSLGTPAYMAPEQVRDPMSVDHRVDIWALGAILYELLTGQLAFVGATVKEVLDRVISESPCPIEKLRRDVPPELAAIIGRALVRDRDQRWSTAALFARALAPFGSIGVTSHLTNISREVGSLSSISAISAVRAIPYAALSSPRPSVEPREATLPDPNEISRRYSVVQDWTAQKARERKARSAVLLMIAVLFFGFSAAVLVYRPAPKPAVVDRSAPVGSALAQPSPPNATTAAIAPPVPLAVAVSATSVTPAALPPASTPRSKNVHHASSVPKAPHRAPRRSPRQ